MKIININVVINFMVLKILIIIILINFVVYNFILKVGVIQK